ncbi:MAG TPA: hypothetical protein VJ834_11110 [Burkholderiales bacterium]|nr:hypothetical protein [Burkholderiales bacterium]
MLTERNERGGIVVIGTQDGKEICRIETETEVRDLAFVTNDELVVGERLAWSRLDLRTRKIERHIVDRGAISDIDLSRGDVALAIANTAKGEVEIIDIKRAQTIQRLRHQGVSGVSLAADDIAVTVGGAKLAVWKVETGALLRETQHQSGRLVIVSPSWLFTWRPWGMGELRKLQTLSMADPRLEFESTSGAAFLSYDALAVAGQGKCEIRSMKTGELLWKKHLNVRSVGAIAASPDGRVLAVATATTSSDYAVAIVTVSK